MLSKHIPIVCPFQYIIRKFDIHRSTWFEPINAARGLEISLNISHILTWNYDYSSIIREKSQNVHSFLNFQRDSVLCLLTQYLFLLGSGTIVLNFYHYPKTWIQWEFGAFSNEPFAASDRTEKRSIKYFVGVVLFRMSSERLKLTLLPCLWRGVWSFCWACSCSEWLVGSVCALIALFKTGL